MQASAIRVGRGWGVVTEAGERGKKARGAKGFCMGGIVMSSALISPRHSAPLYVPLLHKWHSRFFSPATCVVSSGFRLKLLASLVEQPELGLLLSHRNRTCAELKFATLATACRHTRTDQRLQANK